MPKIILPQFFEASPKTLAPTPKDQPCPLGQLIVLKNSVRFYIKSDDEYVVVIYPYDSGEIQFDLQYTVPKSLYNCEGWPRRAYAYTITIWDSKHKCVFTVPALVGINS